MSAEFFAPASVTSALSKVLQYFCQGHVTFSEWAEVSGSLTLATNAGHCVTVSVNEKLLRLNEKDVRFLTESCVVAKASSGCPTNSQGHDLVSDMSEDFSEPEINSARALVNIDKDESTSVPQDGLLDVQCETLKTKRLTRDVTFCEEEIVTSPDESLDGLELTLENIHEAYQLDSMSSQRQLQTGFTDQSSSFNINTGSAVIEVGNTSVDSYRKIPESQITSYEQSCTKSDFAVQMPDNSQETSSAFDVGTIFSSFEKFQEALERFQEANGYIYRLSSSSTVDSYNRNSKRKRQPYPAEWKYRRAFFTCKMYGLSERKEKTGQARRPSWCYGIGCESYILIAADTSKHGLVIKKFVKGHNHEPIRSLEDAVKFPEKRRLKSAQQKEVDVMISNGMRPGQIVKAVEEKFNKRLKCSDIQNRKRFLRSKRIESQKKSLPTHITVAPDV